MTAAADAAVTELLLEAHDVAGPDRWRWELTGPDGGVLARHTVRLDPGSSRYEAFLDLPGHVRRHAAPDERTVRERQIVREVGEWIGTEILGPVGPALAAAAPAVVRVVVPADARRLLYVPLELAHVRGRPLALRNVSLVMRLGTGRTGHPVRAPAPDGERPVRVLALFSMPEGERALNLRRERVGLARLFADAARAGRGVELRTLQYGVTRDRLRAVLAAPEGWDVVHVSGHGTPGELLLETEAGRPDRVPAAELARLLAPAAHRVGLVTLSACWSATLTVREQRRVLGLPVDADEGGAGPGPRTGPVGALAGELAERLDCAVLAMRYAVPDGYAIALAERLYALLVIEGHPLPRALATTLGELSARGSSSVLESATPALFGERAARLTLAAPRRPDGSAPDAGARAAGEHAGAAADGSPPTSVEAPAPTAGRPGGEPFERFVGPPASPGPTPTGAETAARAGGPGGTGDHGPGGAGEEPPERFVGRVGVLARAGTALAVGGGRCGVLLHGMPGAGKTACARELVATHRHAFEGVVWFKAPERRETDDAQDVLAGFALALERAVPEFAGVRLLDEPGGFREFTDAVAGCLARHRLLLVLDHVDALLTATGAWRDERWGPLLTALSGHAGPGRIVLTARLRPPGLGPRVHREPVGMLSADEALLLTRELPGLAALLDGRLPGLDPTAARRYATALLEVTQGHPKLLELADRQASDPARLAGLLGAAGRAWSEGAGPPDGFFTTGRATPSEADYARVLGAWSDGIADALAPAHRDLFRFLCCLEEDDRTRPAVEHNWPDLRARLGHPDAPLDTGLRALTAYALIGVRPPTASGETPVSYEVQAAVAADGRHRAGERFRELVDTRLAGYWTRVFEAAWQREGTEADGARSAGPLLAHSGLSAAPYLIRLGQYESAEVLLTTVLRRDGSRPTRNRVLPVVRHLAALAAAGDAPRAPAGALAEVLWATAPAAAERLTRKALAAALERGDHAAASTAAATLCGLCLRTGRLAEAAGFADAETDHARRAGLGPWTRLLGEVHRLHVLVERARSGQVLAEADVLRRRTDELPRRPEPGEAVAWWEVWEELCDTAQRAAVDAGHWSRALEYNAELCRSKLARGAPAPDLAQARFPAYMPLLRLGRAEEALELLEPCRAVFEAAGEDLLLGEVFGSLANVEDTRGRGDLALARGRDCLRYAYRAGAPSTIAVSHANFGSYLHAHARDGAGACAHHLAGALLGVLIDGRTVDAVGAAAGDLREFGPAAEPPPGPEALCARVGEVSGVALDALLGRLAAPERVSEVLAALGREARRLAGTDASADGADADPAARVAAAAWGIVWEPAIAALVSAERGNTAAKVKLRQHLDHYAGLAPLFAPLAGVLRRVLDGDRAPGVGAGLGPLDAPVAARALAALRGEADVPVQLWPVMHLGLVLGNLVTASSGDSGTATTTRENLDRLRADPALAPLAPVLADVLAGRRDSGLAARLRDPTQRATVTVLLRCLDDLEGSGGPGGLNGPGLTGC
ncbi:CHAT domain-containing protein [Streptomyces sp. NPDC000351]|uniref:CHAT domain-containing protein n=1 Tax=Streptomyces sp. NPDC000351 TaxID=3154250 RepID=UPI00332D1965